ncbi:hypothetical protein [Crateriforma conspicua]|uniref:Uncharacterized protein n=1 Tax=Crateriforma conspicua TaxID=2527996 RepID=A0A5C5Y637_9PLAN|nr:hypothetical protein [Crateriforma conspicua]QDV64302.1 hypothetical protein Mal65_34550 [Crateriforma conspicua]TWT69695.1 hypothetical protein Pan14r_19860 [Crateriforma conspicua]
MKSLRNVTLALTAAALVAITAAPADAGCLSSCCEPAPVCCCPPPPVPVTWCVTDPTTCCKHQVTACVPACCAGEVPCLVSCKRGFLGRKILTYKFQCCGHCVDVVITHFGKVIVRD